MRIIIMAQEEPTNMGPFLVRLLEKRREDVVAVAVGQLRGAGGPVRDAGSAWTRLRTLWLLFEPLGVLRLVWIRCLWKLLRWLGPLGSPFDRRSLDRAARRLGLPVLRFSNPNTPEFLEQLRAFDPDFIFNQSDCLLKQPLLDLPRRGVVNRHGSRLPRHRGRLASFYAHADFQGRCDITVHFVDADIDSGPIIHHHTFPMSRTAPYATVLRKVFEASADVVDEAFSKLEAPGFEASPNDVSQGTMNGFPSLAQAREYRQRLAEHRRDASQ